MPVALWQGAILVRAISLLNFLAVGELMEYLFHVSKISSSNAKFGTKNPYFDLTPKLKF